MFRPEYNKWQNVALLLQKCVKISSRIVLLLYPKVSQVKCYNTSPQTPPTHIFSSANMFFYVI